MGQVVADTHAAVWHLFGSSRLSTAARAAFEQTTLAGDSILVPTISIVEVCYPRHSRKTSRDYVEFSARRV
jgi:PIN domain nuclease of toxin-antitoxin system